MPLPTNTSKRKRDSAEDSASGGQKRWRETNNTKEDDSQGQKREREEELEDGGDAERPGRRRRVELHHAGTDINMEEINQEGQRSEESNTSGENDAQQELDDGRQGARSYIKRRRMQKQAREAAVAEWKHDLRINPFPPPPTSLLHSLHIKTCSGEMDTHLEEWVNHFKAPPRIQRPPGYSPGAAVRERVKARQAWMEGQIDPEGKAMKRRVLHGEMDTHLEEWVNSFKAPPRIQCPPGYSPGAAVRERVKARQARLDHLMALRAGAMANRRKYIFITRGPTQQQQADERARHERTAAAQREEEARRACTEALLAKLDLMWAKKTAKERRRARRASGRSSGE
ncbi:hypothetical protein C8R43DRAFT_1125333 [Mycena crocata]|nr:hypothetical protein C8R43DRAFT_1125333 [Mycena crocata]